MKRGMTLLELLVSMALSLLLIFAIGQFFVYVTSTISDGRAIVEMGGNIRGAVKQLKDDLAQLTAPATPTLDPASGLGFFEYVEGYAWDMDVDADTAMDTNATMQGDVDDLLSFTIRSTGQPFTGQWIDPADGQPKQVESHLAEVVWFTTFKDADNDGVWDAADEQRFLVRRHLLVMPNVAPTNAADFHQHNDISAHYDRTTNRWVPNSLQSLTNRENRFIHQNLATLAENGLRAADATQPQAFMPNPLQLAVSSAQALQRYTLQGSRRGEDVTLPNLLAFDVRAYDQLAPMYPDSEGEAALQPGDPGYAAALGLPMAQAIGWGAYVDLNYNRTFGGNMTVGFAPASSDATPNYSTWETWSVAYERDGLDQLVDSKVDWAFDGLDNNPTPTRSIIDDETEYETQPPYVTPLRGVQVRIRMYEPGTRQTRQATVVSSFAR
jgi:prepilin-type N-terminal cleavage/methylation domain-containing protein